MSPAQWRLLPVNKDNVQVQNNFRGQLYVKVIWYKKSKAHINPKDIQTYDLRNGRYQR
jgi:hypothetical protein